MSASIVRLPREPGVDAEPGAGEAETPKERTNRQLVEILNELRVALPGAQFLFAFLLTVPFAARFAEVSQGLRIVFFACLLCTLVATILLIAPAVYHRVRWQQGDKEDVIRMAHRMFLAGMTCLGVAMATAVGFVSYVLLGAAAAAAAAAISVALVALTWYVLPLRGRFGDSARVGAGASGAPEH